jgi:hypothetical protein
LLITERFEPTADCLLAELRRQNVPCLRWNLDQFPVAAALTYRASNDQFEAEMSIDGRKLSLQSVGSIWCRGFRPSGFADGLHEEDLKFVNDEAQRAMDALLSVMDVLWVRINSQANPETAIDWRRRPFDVDKPIELPADIQAKTHALMRAFGLNYGAFDFIVTPDGRHTCSWR